MPLQWRNQIWQSLEEGPGKRCWESGLEAECPGIGRHGVQVAGITAAVAVSLLTVHSDTALPFMVRSGVGMEGGGKESRRRGISCQ